MKSNVVNVAILVLTASIASLGVRADLWPVNSFSATRIEFNKVQPAKEKRSKVYMDKTGMREEELDGQKPAHARVTVIVNFESGKTWLLIPHRKIYVEQPAADAPGVTTSDEPGTVLAQSPCEGYSVSEKRGVAKHEGRKAEEWHCDTGTKKVIQLFDPALHVVVRSEDAKGFVAELRGIQAGAQPASLFAVPSGFRPASMREVMTNRVELPSYRDTEK